jgi:hypothetical protein
VISNESTFARIKALVAGAVTATLLALVVGCTTPAEPKFPHDTSPTAIADLVRGPDGQAFLRGITTYSWEDGGQRAGELFTWIPQDAKSVRQADATRAGETAHAIASFLADERTMIAGAPPNSALLQAFSVSLTPYLGAAVGDDSGTAGFLPLDGLGSPMRRTTALFAAMKHSLDADREFTGAAGDRAAIYERSFAKAAAGIQYRPTHLSRIEISYRRPDFEVWSRRAPTSRIRRRRNRPLRTPRPRWHTRSPLSRSALATRPSTPDISMQAADFCLPARSLIKTGASTTVN